MRKEDIYLAILFLLFTLLIYSLLIFPKNNQFLELKNLAKQKEIEFLGLERYFQKLEDTSKKLENYKEEISKINQAIPDDPGLVQFLDFIQKKSTISGLSLTKLAPFEKVERGRVKDWKIRMSFSGDYNSLKNFLRELDKSSRLIRVGDISFSTLKEGKSFDIQITLVISSK